MLGCGTRVMDPLPVAPQNRADTAGVDMQLGTAPLGALLMSAVLERTPTVDKSAAIQTPIARGGIKTSPSSPRLLHEPDALGVQLPHISEVSQSRIFSCETRAA